MLSQYWLIVVFLSWTDKQQTSVSSACKSLRRLIFYFMQIPVRSQPFLFLLERVSVEATWALGWVDHWATPAMRWTTFSQMKRKTRYIQTGTLIHFPIQRIREIGMQRDGEIYVWYFHFFLFTPGLDEVHWPQRQNWYCKLLRPKEFFQVAHTWTPHCSAGALDVGG